MQPFGRWALIIAVLPAMGVLGAAFAAAADEKAGAAEYAVTIVLGPGQATATPFRQGSSRTGGGNVHVTQPAPDTLSVTMTGAAVAKAHPFTESVAGFSFELAQFFEVVGHAPRVKGAKLVLWGRAVGLLRSDCCCGTCGSAEVTTPGRAVV